MALAPGDQITRTAGWLQASLLPDAQQRQAAEAALQEGELQPGHAVALFRLAVDMTLQIDPVLRQTAAVHMKNVCNRRWDPPTRPLRGEGTRTLPLSDADKASIRDNLVEAMCMAAPQVRVQLGTVLRSAAHVDYPDNWPTLLPTICSNIRTEEANRLHGGLFSLRLLAKVHQFRRERTAPLHALVAETFPLLLGMLRNILAAPPSVANSEIALLAAKTMWSAIQSEIPPILLSPGALGPWFEIILGLLAQPLPTDGNVPTDNEEAASWAPWKLKKRVAQIMHRVLQRYGNPGSGKDKQEGAQEMSFGGATDQTQMAPSDQAAQDKAKEAATRAFARAFQDHVSGKCLQGCLQLLQRATRKELLPGRVHNLCLSYIEEAIRYKTTYTAILKPQVQELFNEVVYPPLCFTEEDAELWDSDPQEYVRRSLDVIEDYYSPRTAATNLLIALTTSRAKDCLQGIVQKCSQVLNAALNSTDMALLRQKDGALLALGSLRKHLTKREDYRGSLEPMLRTHVLPLLSDQNGFLRQRGCWVYAQFASTIFKGVGASGEDGGAPSPAAEQMAHAFPAIMAGLRDRDLPVRVQAAVTIKELVEQQCMPPTLIELLPQLMELLFSLLQEVGADEIVSTVDTLIEHYGEQMVPYAVQVVTALSATFMRLLDETDEDDEDDATLAALGVMQALGTMMEAVSGKAEIYRNMEQPLMPLFTRCCQQDAEDYFEEMLELLAYITYYATDISPQLWELVPQLHAVYHDWGRDYVNNLSVPLDNFISRSPEAFLTLQNGGIVQMVVSIIRDALVSEHATESFQEGDAHGAPRLIESMMHACPGRIDPVVPDLMQYVLMRLDTAETRGYKILLYSALSSSIHYNPVLALQVLEHRQATTQVLTSWANHLSTTEKLRRHDFKIGLLAASALLSLPNASAPAMVASNRLHLLRLGLTVHKRLAVLREQKAAEDEDEDEDEEGDDDDDYDELGDELDDDEEGGKELSTQETLARLLRHAAGETSLKKFNLSALTGDFDDDDDEDDLSDDDENYDTEIDKIDELIAFTEAAQVQ